MFIYLKILKIYLIIDDLVEIVVQLCSEIMVNLFCSHNNTEFILDFDGFNANPRYGNGLVFLISLPLLSRSFGINFNLNDKVFNLTCGNIYRLDINLPFSIDAELAFSFFDSNKRVLIIFLPFHEKDYLLHNEAKKENGNSDTNDKIKLSDQYLYDVIV